MYYIPNFLQAIMIKCAAQGYKFNDRDWNPHSADDYTRAWAGWTKPLSHNTPIDNDIYQKNNLPSLDLKSRLKVIHAYFMSFTQHKDLNIEFGISTLAMFTVRLIPVPGRECRCVIVQQIIAWISYSSNRLDAVFLAIFFCHNSSKLIKISQR